jgi:carbon-monoxide dehydrogenase medium subunit
MSGYDYFKPGSLEELWDLSKKYPQARYIAGGTDLMVKIKKRLVKPAALISLRSIPQLVGIEIGETTRIGAATTITDLIEHPRLGALFPVLIQAAKRLGGVQIRNVATIGGNLCNCSPCADTALPLLFLDARATMINPQGSRGIPLAEFFKGPGESCLLPGEILADIILDKSAPGTKAVFMKKGRVRMDLSIASLALLLEMESDNRTCKKARLAAGSAAPTPLRLTAVEQLFENTEISEALLAEAQQLAASSVSPITDIRASESYRRRLVSVYLGRAVRELVDITK